MDDPVGTLKEWLASTYEYAYPLEDGLYRFEGDRSENAELKKIAND